LVAKRFVLFFLVVKQKIKIANASISKLKFTKIFTNILGFFSIKTRKVNRALSFNANVYNKEFLVIIKAK